MNYTKLLAFVPQVYMIIAFAGIGCSSSTESNKHNQNFIPKLREEDMKEALRTAKFSNAWARYSNLMQKKPAMENSLQKLVKCTFLYQELKGARRADLQKRLHEVSVLIIELKDVNTVVDLQRRLNKASVMRPQSKSITELQKVIQDQQHDPDDEPIVQIGKSYLEIWKIILRELESYLHV